MPTVSHNRLHEIAEALLIGAGASREEAEIVARHCVGANLAGHDSHGVIAVPTYIDRIKRGHIIPGAPYEVERESANHMVVNGKGQVVAGNADNRKPFEAAVAEM